MTDDPPSSKPGPRPRRLFVRRALVPPGNPEEPETRTVHRFLESLQRSGRLVAHGPLTNPKGDLLILRARDYAEADRTLRLDPYRTEDDRLYRIDEWAPGLLGSGVNLEPPPARGSGRITGLEQVTVVVRHQDRAEAWYRDVLGFTVRARDRDSGFLEMALARGGVAVSLVAPRLEWGEPFYSEALGRLGRPTGIVFQTDSVEALDLRIRHGGGRITAGPRTEPWGGRSLRFSDPDGNEYLAFDELERSLPPSLGKQRPSEQVRRASQK